MLVWPGGKGIVWRKGLPERTGGRKKLWMVPGHSCYLYGTWKSKEVGRGVKVVIHYDYKIYCKLPGVFISYL